MTPSDNIASTYEDDSFLSPPPRPPQSLTIDIDMIDERPVNSSQTQVERQSIKAGMSNFLDHQAKFFNQRFTEAKATLKASYGTLDTIKVSHPELRAAL
ncbi:hypothetical protein GcM1_048003 [Golovinomyces cichoracearum]|uniref:Uncharacterized protein n=1 Tax=Golovinomyces cichoracearum TaxID=62708 RepID=A0A420JCK2_9PEZI|nr:hypothetical protein GcM1_048003 [Golovinomyces cichoracearum]